MYQRPPTREVHKPRRLVVLDDAKSNMIRDYLSDVKEHREQEVERIKMRSMDDQLANEINDNCEVTVETDKNVVTIETDKNEVSATDIVNAEKFFGTLAHMTTSQLPQSRLLSLLGEKKKQLLLDEKNKKPGEPRLTDRTAESVGRAGLVYTPPDISQQKAQDQTRRRAFVSSYMSELAKEAILTNQKQSLVQQMWPQIFAEMVRTTVHEMWDSKAYMKQCMEELERS